MQIHRGYDYTEDSTGEHYYRDVTLLTVGEGTSVSQRQIITRRLLGTYRLECHAGKHHKTSGRCLSGLLGRT